MLFLDVVLGVAIIGTFTSTIVLILSVLGTVQFRRCAESDRKKYEEFTARLPSVSVLKPVHGNEAHLKENLD